MAHKDGNGYYCMVALFENGEMTVRRIQRLEWQGDDGSMHFLEGKVLPNDINLQTGRGFKDNHLGQWLGVKTAPGKSLLPGLPKKSDVLYMVIGAALLVIFKGVLILATTGL